MDSQQNISIASVGGASLFQAVKNSSVKTDRAKNSSAREAKSDNVSNGKALDAVLSDEKQADLQVASKEANEQASQLQELQKAMRLLKKNLFRKTDAQPIEDDQGKADGDDAVKLVELEEIFKTSGQAPPLQEKAAAVFQAVAGNESAGPGSFRDVSTSSLEQGLASFEVKLERVKEKFKEVVEEMQSEDDSAEQLSAELAAEMAQITQSQIGYLESSAIAVQVTSNTLYQTESLFR